MDYDSAAFPSTTQLHDKAFYEEIKSFNPPKEIVSKAIQDAITKDLPKPKPHIKKIAVQLETPEIPSYVVPLDWWSESALKVLNERYLSTYPNGVKETPEAMLYRVARAAAEAEAEWVKLSDYELTLDKFSQQKLLNDRVNLEVNFWTKEFYTIMAENKFLPNSPTLMNAGTGNGLNFFACFVMKIEDSIEDIYDTLKNAAIIAKSGGGIGHCFSNLRPSNSKVSTTQGMSSGPISFLKLYDASTAAIKQGGKRRGANMATFAVDHPDLMDFIHCKLFKEDGTRDITNFNISVLATDAFMKAVQDDADWNLIDKWDNNKVTATYKARYIFDEIAQSAWATGDPGFLFIDKANNSRSNPIPDLEMLDASNPCFIGSMRLATSRGLITFKELYDTQEKLHVVVDNRAIDHLQKMTASGETVSVLGTSVYNATPVSLNGKNIPVLKLTTSHGHEVIATPYHKFITPNGRVELKDLKEGDTLYLQSEEGLWSENYDLPTINMGSNSQSRLNNKIAKGLANPPVKWSKELGQMVGLIIGDGFIRYANNGSTLGISISDQDFEIKEFVLTNMEKWFGVTGNRSSNRNNNSQIQYSSGVADFFASLGISNAKAPNKVVPESIFQSPRESVIGFLRGLFSADGTINIVERNGTVSIRLATSSHQLGKDVQQLLANLGIVGALRLRRKAQVRMMPDSNRVLAPYNCAAQYEIIISRNNMTEFVSIIGFMQNRQNDKIGNYLKSHSVYSEKFETAVKSIEPYISEDVYCCSVPGPNSIIVNNIATMNCGEQIIFTDDACNLGSINLGRFVEDDGSINYTNLSFTSQVATRLLDNIIDVNNYPLPQIDKKVKSLRRIGLGVMGWADMLFKYKCSYDSEAAFALAEKVMATINNSAVSESRKLAEYKGPFPLFSQSIYKNEAPRRNSCLTTQAPTGTISIIDNCSSGIEPVFALAYQHKVKQNNGERVLNIVNDTFKRILESEDLYTNDVENYVAVNGVITGYNDYVAKSQPSVYNQLPEWVEKTFIIAQEIDPKDHIAMQAAWQVHTENSISKTVNLPNSATVQDIKDAYMLAYESGCKGITVFRDGCLATGQVLNIGTNKEKIAGTHVTINDGIITHASVISPGSGNPVQGFTGSLITVNDILDVHLEQEEFSRPKVLHGYTRQVVAPEGTVHVTLNSDDAGDLREVFVNVGRSGSDISALSEALGRLISLILQMDASVANADKLYLIQSQLNGIGGSGFVGFGPNRVASLADAVSKVIREHPLNLGQPNLVSHVDPTTPNVVAQQIKKSVQKIGNACPSCGNIGSFVREEGCKKCYSCGYSEC